MKTIELIKDLVKTLILIIWTAPSVILGLLTLPYLVWSVMERDKGKSMEGSARKPLTGSLALPECSFCAIKVLLAVFSARARAP